MYIHINCAEFIKAGLLHDTVDGVMVKVYKYYMKYGDMAQTIHTVIKPLTPN